MSDKRPENPTPSEVRFYNGEDARRDEAVRRMQAEWRKRDISPRTN